MFNLGFEFGVDNSQQQVHEQEETQDQVNDEEKAGPSIVLVCWEHDIGVVGSGHKDKHGPEGVPECIEIFYTLQSSCKESLEHPTEVEDVHYDEEEHWQ